jgi:hypothetical protein
MSRLLPRTGIATVLALLGACGQEQVATPTSPRTIAGSGVIVSQARSVPGFTAVTVAGPLRLLLEQAGTESLVVTTDDNVIPFVQSEVRDGRLYLGLVPDTSLTRISEIVCRVTLRELRDLDASGAARTELRGIDAARLAVHLSGAVVGSASGAVDQIHLDVSGASRWSAGELRGRAVTSDISGASYGLVRASHSLVARVNGVSTLEYLGDPVVVPTVDGLSVFRRVGP